MPWVKRRRRPRWGSRVTVARDGTPQPCTEDFRHERDLEFIAAVEYEKRVIEEHGYLWTDRGKIFVPVKVWKRKESWQERFPGF